MTASTEYADAVAALAVQLDRLAELQAKLRPTLREYFRAEHWVELGRIMEREEAEERRGRAPAPRRTQPGRERPAHLSPVKSTP
jgi:hypothetical protein